MRHTAEVAEHAFADVAKNISVGLVVWHLENLNDARTLILTAANSAAEQAVDMPLTQRLGETLPQIFPEIASTPRLEIYAEVVRRQEAVDLGETRSGETRQRVYNVRAFPLPNQSVALSFEDITARKKTEDAQRLERESAMAASHELQAFSYSVSHDLRAPLRAIDGFGQVLLEDYANQLDENGKQYLARIRAAAQKMGQIMDDMIELSLVTRSKLHKTLVDLTIMAREIEHTLHAVEPDRQIEVIIQDGMTTEGDATLLRAAMENLIGNAWKFTSKQSTARIEIGEAPRVNGRKVYFVRDNGAGFDMTYATKLFNAFQRLHSITEFPGTGIGLAIVERVMRRHGGRAWAESSVGRGATFFFML